MHMLDSQTAQSLIKPHMPVVCSENGQFATVDHLEGSDEIKLTRDKNGQHHFIPVSWITSVDDKVHVDRPGDQAMQEWRTEPRGQKQQGQQQAMQTQDAKNNYEKREQSKQSSRDNNIGDQKPGVSRSAQQHNEQNNRGNAPRTTK